MNKFLDDIIIVPKRWMRMRNGWSEDERYIYMNMKEEGWQPLFSNFPLAGYRRRSLVTYFVFWRVQIIVTILRLARNGILTCECYKSFSRHPVQLLLIICFRRNSNYLYSAVICSSSSACILCFALKSIHPSCSRKTIKIDKKELFVVVNINPFKGYNRDPSSPSSSSDTSPK